MSMIVIIIVTIVMIVNVATFTIILFSMLIITNKVKSSLSGS